MLRIQNYVRPQTLEDAYHLCQKKNAVVLGGMLWLKMQKRSVHTAIDLQDLGLNRIEETETDFRLGAMVTLRELELHPALNSLTQGAMAECVKHIVGVQFRNTATVGGSIFGRFGFSDVLTLFLALDARVELYHGGVMPLSEFVRLSRPTRDLLIHVIVPKQSRRTVYLSQRNISTDFPVLTCAVSKMDGSITCAVGARPGAAVCLHEIPDGDPQTVADAVTDQLSFGRNVRAGAEYRARICRVLVRRALQTLNEQEG